ncbi:MAG: hypothetical protein M3P18_19900 [Actinomycetota bacterium]|nr:hypothetical protein [Actinomycetota bacterium]
MNGRVFVGPHFPYAMTSDTVTGVVRDAKRIAKQVMARRTETRRPTARIVA